MTPRRPNMGLATKLAACLIHMGYHPADACKAAGIKLPPAPEGALAWSAAAMDERPRSRIDFDHSPALGLRPTNNRHPSSLVWIPGANDPRWVSPIGKAPHGVKTKDDTTRAAKVKRIVKKEIFRTSLPPGKYRSWGDEIKLGLPEPKGKRAWPKGRKIAARAK